MCVCNIRCVIIYLSGPTLESRRLVSQIFLKYQVFGGTAFWLVGRRVVEFITVLEKHEMS